MNEIKAGIAVLMFIWHALTAYVGTEAGTAELAAIEVDLFPDQAPTTSGGTPAGQQTGSSVRRG